MSAKQRLRVGKRGTVDGQLDWLVEWGEPTEPADGNEMADPRRGRIAKQVRIARQQRKSYHREHKDQQHSWVDQKAR